MAETHGAARHSDLLIIYTPLILFLMSRGFGYVCGGRQFQGTVLKTTDAGETWINQFTGSSSRLYGVFILDENIGYAVGEGRDDTEDK